jgi:hypothetical protein
MPTVHPSYPDYKIYWESLKEKPVGGHFYAQDGKTLYPYHKHTLSWYGKYGCGAVKYWGVINRNVWNRTHLTYRERSDSCFSKKVDSSIALTSFDPGKRGAFIALCENDRSDLDTQLGSLFQILYIPKDCSAAGMNENPDDTKPKYPIAPGPSVLPKIINKTLLLPTTVVSVDKPQFITPTIVQPSEPEKGPFGPGQIPTGIADTEISYPPTYPPVEDEGGIPWWVWLLLLAGGGMVGVVSYKRAKKGKKGKRKRRR